MRVPVTGRPDQTPAMPAAMGGRVRAKGAPLVLERPNGKRARGDRGGTLQEVAKKLLVLISWRLSWP